MFGRNNEDRMGAKEPSSDISPAIAQQQEQKEESFQFSFSTPTEFVELPSKGRFYLEGHPLHGKDSVEIRFMTAKDEDILTSKTLLRKGIAIDRMLSNVLVDKTLNPDDLLIGDKNALVLAARITGYGAQYDTEVSCPACATNVRHQFDLNEKDYNFGDDFGDFEVEETPEKTFIVSLPVTKAKVEIRMLSGHDEKEMNKTAKNRKRANLPESSMTDMFRLYIRSVNGSKDRKAIESLIDHMPALDSKYLRFAYKQVQPNVDMVQEFTCPECGLQQDMEVPFTAAFFWPDR